MNYGLALMQWSDNAWVMSVYFLTLRLGAMLLLTPILYAGSMPASVRTFLILSLCIAISAGILPSDIPVLGLAPGAGALIVASLRELMLGASFALGILLAFAAISVAGRLLDVQIGFGMAQVFDPLTRRQLPLLTSAFNQLGIILFFLINAHHTLLRALALSVEKFPLGRAWDMADLVLPVVRQVGGLFSFGFALASPVVFCVLLVELALGVVSRNLPQMNMFVMGVPVKIVVGLFALSLWFLAVGDVMTRIHGSIFQTWDWMLSGPVNATHTSVSAAGDVYV